MYATFLSSTISSIKNITSSTVNGSPSDHFIPFLSFILSSVPSLFQLHDSAKFGLMGPSDGKGYVN